MRFSAWSYLFYSSSSCFLFTTFSRALLHACSFDRSAFVSSFVDSPPLWLPLATQSSVPSGPLGLPLSRLSDDLSSLLRTSVPHLARASTASAAVFQSAFPAEFVVVVVVDVIISVEAPCVAAGFLRTPALTLPLYQETPRAQQPRRKETDRPPSSDPCSLRPLSSKESERKMEDQRRWYGTRKEGAIESATRIN